MSVIKYALVAVGCIATHAVFAETTTLAFNSSPLMPGSHVVAGDLSKNEFFITGSQPAIKTLAQEDHNGSLPVKQPSAVALAPKIKMAASKPVETKIFVPQIKMALNKTFKPSTEKKQLPIVHPLPIETHTALKQPPHDIRHGNLRLSNNVVKPNQHKVVSHKTHFYSFKQPIHKQHVRVASVRTHAAANKKMVASRKTVLPKSVIHHSPHKSFAQAKGQKYQYKFVSLTSKRHALHVKTALREKHDQIRKIAVAKI